MPEAGGEAPDCPAPSWGAGGPPLSWGERHSLGRGRGHSPDLGDIPEMGAPLLPPAGGSTRGRPAPGGPAKTRVWRLGGGASLLVPSRQGLMVQEVAGAAGGTHSSGDQGLSGSGPPLPRPTSYTQASCARDFNPVGAIMVPRVPGSPDLGVPWTKGGLGFQGLVETGRGRQAGVP